MTTIRRVRLFRSGLGYGWTYEVRNLATGEWHEQETEGHWNRAYAWEDAQTAAARHGCPLVAPDSIIRAQEQDEWTSRPAAKRHHLPASLARRRAQGGNGYVT